MRRLAGRVARLERETWAARSGICGLCGDLGMPGVEVRTPGKPTTRPTGCAMCGRVSGVKLILIEERPEPGPEPRREPGCN